MTSIIKRIPRLPLLLRSRLAVPALSTLVIALAVACGSSAVATAVPATPQPDPTAINTIMATTVLEVGEQRVAFLLTTTKGLIKTPTALVTPVYLDGGNASGEAGETGETMEARFNLWPYGSRGSYSTYIDFDKAGRWRLDVQVDNPNGVDEVQIEVEVMERLPVPALGSIAPLSITKTLGEQGDIAQITTDYSPDPDLYQLSIKEAVENDLPSVVVFASPAFCTTPTCGPQVDTVSELMDTYPGRANFIHVEIYDNPQEIQGDLDEAEIFSVVDDWGLTSIPGYFNESWTFILDTDGRILDRFEGFATLDELESALLPILPQA